MAKTTICAVEGFPLVSILWKYRGTGEKKNVNISFYLIDILAVTTVAYKIFILYSESSNTFHKNMKSFFELSSYNILCFELNLNYLKYCEL